MEVEGTASLLSMVSYARISSRFSYDCFHPLLLVNYESEESLQKGIVQGYSP
jgi:hypothetical protein